MRTPKYLSPTSVALFYSSIDEFYLKYLADTPPPRMPQTAPMSVGSAFDAHVKSYIYEKFYGKKDPDFELTTIFEKQVEPQNRDFALEAGAYCFECYKKYGSLADLMLELDAASEAPRMEFTVEGKVAHDTCVDGVPLSGKPDLRFVTKEGLQVVYDWKVNGYCGNGNTSPAKGYVMVRGDVSFNKLNQMHKDTHLMHVGGLRINIGQYLEQVKEDWAQQLSIYSWLLGMPVGADFVIGIDQLVFQNPGRKCRIAAHRCKISPLYQRECFSKIAWAWKVIQSGHIFRDLTPEASGQKQAMLDQQFAAFVGDGSAAEKWFTETFRQHRNF